MAVGFLGFVSMAGVQRVVELTEDADAGFLPGWACARGTLNGIPIRVTLCPGGPEGRRRFFVDGALRKVADVDAGDEVVVELEPDPNRREPKVPDILANAMVNAGLESVFLNLTTAKRREIVRWITLAQREETKKARIAKVLRRLESWRPPP